VAKISVFISPDAPGLIWCPRRFWSLDTLSSGWTGDPAGSAHLRWQIRWHHCYERTMAGIQYVYIKWIRI
jgi:hypothetical protein